MIPTRWAKQSLESKKLSTPDNKSNDKGKKRQGRITGPRKEIYINLRCPMQIRSRQAPKWNMRKFNHNRLADLS